MTTIWKTLLAITSVGAACFPQTVLADDFGEAWIDSNISHVRVEINGKVWEDVEYEKNGRRCVIKQLEFSKLPATIRLIARDGGFTPVEIKVVRKDFKRKRQGRYYIWVVKHKVRFAKASKKKARLLPLRVWP